MAPSANPAEKTERAERFLSLIHDRWGDLVEGGTELSFHAGQVLFYEGHLLYGIYLVRSGHVRFTKDGKTCLDDHLQTFDGGAVCGLSDFLGTRPSPCTCTAVDDCTVILISKGQLLNLLVSPSDS